MTFTRFVPMYLLSIAVSCTSGDNKETLRKFELQKQTCRELAFPYQFSGIIAGLTDRNPDDRSGKMIEVELYEDFRKSGLKSCDYYRYDCKTNSLELYMTHLSIEKSGYSNKDRDEIFSIIKSANSDSLSLYSDRQQLKYATRLFD